MKLIIAIIDDEFSQDVVKALIDAKIRTTTLLIGVEESDLVSVMGLIRSHIKSPKSNGGGDLDAKGANLFILDIDEHERI